MRSSSVELSILPEEGEPIKKVFALKIMMAMTMRPAIEFLKYSELSGMLFSF
jgi:hypothetical protein